ncbi:hypothetical protein H5410_012209 [Solanum commersonii]|uniref:Uncharacterized protein n=1 Tax=Solanum commersonii TaxID=4109 RepID=A0A9J6AS84_SOLCO|nr:hypothetical protein H5410_012209 [Solanum commersonii]
MTPLGIRSSFCTTSLDKQFSLCQRGGHSSNSPFFLSLSLEILCQELFLEIQLQASGASS